MQAHGRLMASIRALGRCRFAEEEVGPKRKRTNEVAALREGSSTLRIGGLTHFDFSDDAKALVFSTVTSAAPVRAPTPLWDIASVGKSSPIDTRSPPSSFDEGHVFSSRLHRKLSLKFVGYLGSAVWIPAPDFKENHPSILHATPLAQFGKEYSYLSVFNNQYCFRRQPVDTKGYRRKDSNKTHL